MTARDQIIRLLAEQFALRNSISADYFPRNCETLAAACQQMAERFRRGGRLLAAGRGRHATDAQHVSVEFVHPVIVGKRACRRSTYRPIRSECSNRSPVQKIS